MPNMMAIGQTVRGFLVPRLSRSLKVIRTDTDRSATYDFLLVVHSNSGPISYRFQDKRVYFGRNIQIFS